MDPWFKMLILNNLYGFNHGIDLEMKLVWTDRVIRYKSHRRRHTPRT